MKSSILALELLDPEFNGFMVEYTFTWDMFDALNSLISNDPGFGNWETTIVRDIIRLIKKELNMTMTAEQARKKAQENNERVEEGKHLLNHFEQLIARASNAGKFSIEKQSFSKDRFRPDVVVKVLDVLRERGYKVSEGTNNAQHQITIDVAW